jgi:putative MATE family efflux protein
MSNAAKFVEGSLMRHIIVMSSTSAVGLVSIFLVDLLDMWFISLLGDSRLVAAIGFATTLTFFATSISIGTSIAAGALVSKCLGSKDRKLAKEYATNTLIIASIVSVLCVIIMLLSMDTLLGLLGAKGYVAQVAKTYLVIVMPASVLLAVGLGASAALRATGDAKGSMMSTLSGGAVNAVLDPILIFSLGLGVTGAAIASVFARLAVFSYAISRAHFKHRLLARPSAKSFKLCRRHILNIAFPAMITNMATPFSNAYVTSAIAVYGNSYVAGYAVIGRLVPVCFGFLFSLSGAIGPILGQNFGAGMWDRLERALKDSLVIIIIFSFAVSFLLWFWQDSIINLFKLDLQASDIVSLFCTFIAITFIFNGMLFVSNAAFNNLGSPRLASALNVGKATIGTVPFVILGSQYWGAGGVLIGQAAGSILFGLLAYRVAGKKILQLRKRHTGNTLKI